MFGTNALHKQRKDDDGETISVQSVFDTIQGEGPFAGVPAVFVRLAGCNLRCYFCDTDFESRWRDVSAVDLADEIRGKADGGINRKYAIGLVVITGGEPMRQNIGPLCADLLEEGFDVQIETAGTVWPEGFEELFHDYEDKLTIVCSPKTGKVHEMIQEHCHNWKYLIQEGQVDLEDGLPNQSTQRKGESLRLFRPARPSWIETPSDTIWLQPCEAYAVAYEPVKLLMVDEEVGLADQKITSSVRDEEQSKRNITLAAELAMRFGYRVSLQLHKLLGLP